MSLKLQSNAPILNLRSNDGSFHSYDDLLFVSSTFVCPTEIIAFSDRIEEFRAINTEVVGCSVDSVFTHLAWYVS